MPINEDQESDIRDFLSTVGLFFQLDKDFDNSDIEKANLVLNQKKICHESYVKLVDIMQKVNPVQGIRLRLIPNVEKKYFELGNIILDKLKYDTDGRDTFLKSCIDKL